VRFPANRSVGCVVVAAGSGERVGADRPKALLEVGGRPLIVWAVERIAAAGLPPPVVVIPDGAADRFVAALAGCEVAELVTGGATRTQSVRAGVAALRPGHAVVALHDAARPLVPVDLVRDVVAAVVDDVLAAAPALMVADTLKRVEEDRVAMTVDRDGLVTVQTPQVFRSDVLIDVLSRQIDATDELRLVEEAIASGTWEGRVVVVPGSPFAAKVTFPDDLALLDRVALVAKEATP